MRFSRTLRGYASCETTWQSPVFAYSRCYELAFPAQVGGPAVLGYPLDRWLCAPAFRRVCPYRERNYA